MRLFVGYDPREAVGWEVFMRSLLAQKEIVSVTTLQGEQRDGTNAFTYARFLVPHYCDFNGWAIWMGGSDMLLRAPLRDLMEEVSARDAVTVVKHDYQTKHPMKYVGTPMESGNRDYPRKNWSSVIVWNCANRMNWRLTPEYVASATGEHLHRFAWLPDERIGELPKEWNWLADEYGPNDGAKLVHWTAGIPGFERYAQAPMAAHWHRMKNGDLGQL